MIIKRILQTPRRLLRASRKAAYKTQALILKFVFQVEILNRVVSSLNLEPPALQLTNTMLPLFSHKKAFLVNRAQCVRA